MNRFEATQLAADQCLLAEPQKPNAETCAARRTILLAEDNNDLRWVMEQMLISMGYAVVPAADAYLASAAYRTHVGVDLLMTDQEMPGRTGLELARELTGLRPALPVMIVTGSILQSSVLNEIADRKWMYVRKPCPMGALESSLQRLLNPSLLSGQTDGHL